MAVHIYLEPAEGRSVTVAHGRHGSSLAVDRSDADRRCADPGIVATLT